LKLKYILEYILLSYNYIYVTYTRQIHIAYLVRLHCLRYFRLNNITGIPYFTQYLIKKRIRLLTFLLMLKKEYDVNNLNVTARNTT